eukprot:406125-Rhodomonas_salina.2
MSDGFKCSHRLSPIRALGLLLFIPEPRGTNQYYSEANGSKARDLLHDCTAAPSAICMAGHAQAPAL